MADNPRMDDVICGLAQMGYANGKNGIEIAEGWIVPYIEALLAVRDGRAKDPAAFPCYGEGTPKETARRIIARLLDAGWRPADADCLNLPDIPETSS